MVSGTIISTERQARDAGIAIEELDAALSSEQVLKAIVAGLPHEVISGVRRSLITERRELAELLQAYQEAKNGNYELLRKRTENDLGGFLISARIMKGLSQKDLARRLGLKEQAIQRWEAEKYRSISLSNYQKVAQTLGVRWNIGSTGLPGDDGDLSYDVTRDDLTKILKHARANGWLSSDEKSDENAIATLVRYVGDHVIRYGTPSLLRNGMGHINRPDNWSLLSWKAQITRRAEIVIEERKPRYRPIDVSWLKDLVRLSLLEDGPIRAQNFLLEHGIVVIVEPQIAGMSVDGAAFLADETPIIGLTLLRDTLDNFWFTLLHEVGHIILHYRTGLSAGFFDDLTGNEVDDFEREANSFASNLLIPEELWIRSPARISKAPETIERFASQLQIHPAIVFGRIRMERKDYSIFSSRIGRGFVRKQLLPAT